uniref:Uncharacterized protein n=1 Tax=Eutreptiella gymnastica TaxID=73025 RepID=A0A7S1NTU1_9EUGL|mmetsp:Transcript_8833/g.15763  ORF Transcript_8833/g.15763 Transcript_8833/m.15763 type:complete len:113 (+) Transcript_8833:56-394(+)
MASDKMDFCEVCMKLVPAANLQLHSLRCRVVAVPGTSAQLERCGSQEWFDQFENPKEKSSLNQRSMMSKHGDGANLRLSGGQRDGMDASINSDCSDDWFDYVEKTRTSDPTP